MVRLPPNKSADRIEALAEQLTYLEQHWKTLLMQRMRAYHAAAPLVRLQSVSEISRGV